MEHRIASLHRPLKRNGIKNITDAMLNVCVVYCAQVGVGSAENSDGTSIAKQSMGKIRPDESRAAGYEDVFQAIVFEITL